MSGGSTKVEAPKPTATERAIQNEQLASLRTSNDLYNTFLPIALQEYGYRPVETPTTAQDARHFNADAYRDWALKNNLETNRTSFKEGNYYGHYNQYAKPKGLNGDWWDTSDTTYEKMSEDEMYANMSDLEKLQYDASKLQSERTIQALKGELPISPALEKSLADEELVLRQALAEKLGPEYMLSTPGQKALAELQQKNDLLREEARRGEISHGTGLMLAQQGYYNTNNANTSNNLIGTSQSGLPYVGAYNQTLSPYLQNRTMQMQANAANAQSNATVTAGLMGGIGQLAGTAGGVALGKWM